MKKIKRFLSLVLATTLLTTSTTNVFANENIGGSGGGSGSGGSASGGVWGTEMQGIRITVINAAGEPAFEFMGKSSLDLLFSTKNLNTSNTYFTSGHKTGAIKNLTQSMDGMDSTVMTFDDYISLLSKEDYYVAEGISKNYKNLKNIKTPLTLSGSTWGTTGNNTMQLLQQRQADGRLGNNALIYSILNSYTIRSGNNIAYLWQPLEAAVNYGNVVWDTFNSTLKQSTSTDLTELSAQKATNRNIKLRMNDGEFGAVTQQDLANLKLNPNSDSAITPTKVVEAKAYGIVIEPIIWTRLRVDANNYTSFYVYGTQASLGYAIEQLNASGKLPSRSNGWAYGGYDTSLFCRAGRKAYVVKENVTMLLGASYVQSGKLQLDTSKKLTMVAPTVDQFTNLTNTGYKVSNADVSSRRTGWGLLMFWGRGQEQIPFTTTRDEPVAQEPQPAPKLTQEILAQTKEEDRQYNIVKVYREYTKENEDEDTIALPTHVTTTVRQNVVPVVEIEDERDYNDYQVKDYYAGYRSDVQNIKESDTWESLRPKNTSTMFTESNKTKLLTTITLEQKTELNTLYVLLEKGSPTSSKSGDIIIEQSQITKSIETEDENINGWGPLTMSFNAPSLEKTCRVVIDEWEDDDGDTHYTYCNQPYDLHDSSYSYHVKNIKPLLSSIQANVGDFSIKYLRGEDAEGDRSSTSEETHNVDTFNMQSVLYRGKDLPTIASYKENAGHTLTQLGLKVAKTPQGKRYTNLDGGYVENIAIELAQNSSLGDYTTTSGHHSNTKTAAHSSLNTLSYSASVLVKTYRGKQKEIGDDNTLGGTYAGQTQVRTTEDLSSYYGKINSTNKHVKWYPYLRMTYQKTGDTNKNDVYVLSEWLSDLVPNDYVEVSWNKQETENLKMLSNQWTTHARATSDYQKELTSQGGIEGWRYANRVLPGGAVFTLEESNKRGNDNTILTRTFQFYLENDVLNNVILEGQDFTLANAKAENDKYINEVRKELNGWSVVQYIAKFNNRDIKKDSESITDYLINENLKVDKGGISLGQLGLTSKTNFETKYYIKNTQELNANSNNIKIKAENLYEKHFKFSADTSGNIFVETKEKATDSWGSKELILTKTQTIADLQNSTLLQIDNKTKVITNLLTVLHRNKGQDTTASWSTDGTWYNEAIDGICIVVYSSNFSMGFKDLTTRSAALDPALCPPNKGVADLFSKANVSQFLTQSRDQTKDNGYIGTFKGITVNVNNHREFIKSQIFAIPNVNVQDLSNN